MFTLRQMGPMRGLKTWLKVNKKDGFDCQSDGRRGFSAILTTSASDVACI